MTDRVMRRAFVTVSLLVACAATARAQSADCAPGITFASLLGGVTIGYTDGQLHIDRLYAVCLPAPATPGATRFPYDPDGGGKLTSRVKRADGEVLNTFVWYAEHVGGLWELSRYKVLGGYEAVKPLAPGNYVLEFAADEKPFYRFPFSVSRIANEDPYEAPGPRYFLEGAWNDYGNLYYQRNDPKSSLTFTAWVQERRGRHEKRSVPYEIQLVRAQDGVLLGADSGTLRLEPRWLRATLSFRPVGDRNSFLRASEVLERDGLYRIRLAIEGRAAAEYSFSVKDGRIELQGRQIREKTDPMDAIAERVAGGRYTSWWLPRQMPK